MLYNCEEVKDWGKRAKQKELNKVKLSRYVAISAWAAAITVLFEIIKDIVDALLK